MTALRAGMDVAAGNLANASTPGFRASQLVLSESAPMQQRRHAGDDGLSLVTAASGVRVSKVRLDMNQGAAVATARSLDVMISGEGFFRVCLPTGGIAYTRCGALEVDSDGQIVFASEPRAVLEPAIMIPCDVVPPIRIDADGRILVTIPDSADLEEVGQVELAVFVNPEALRPIGNQMFVETPESGQPSFGAPGQDSRGSLSQGFPEGSNVNAEAERLAYLRLMQLHRTWSVMTEVDSFVTMQAAR